LVVSPAWKRPDLALPQPTTEQLFVAPAVPLAPPPPAAEGDIAMLLYTSGTTGRSKGVQLTHRCLAHQAALLAACWELNPSTRLLHTLPLHHMHGIAIALLPTLLAGGSAALCARFDAEQVWALFGEGVTFMGVPTMYHRLVEAFDRADDSTRARWQGKARALALATSGSAALPVGLAKRWREIAGAIPLERYGMTEVGVLCSNPVETNARRVGWVGTALPTLELSLRDDDGNIIEAEHGEARLGEIWVRGPSLFSGYWRRADADAKAFSDGWFRTGDRGERDDDGCVRILGRRSVDILKSGGYKLSALEIEEIFREHPAIADVAVVGLPDEALGQRVAAAVVAHDGRTNECAGELLELWARERLAGYKLPRVYRVVDALPRNTLGKVLKKQVVALLDETISCPD
jgi:malonyl-CoA/methylmalonyl-CoA synthetase